MQGNNIKIKTNQEHFGVESNALPPLIILRLRVLIILCLLIGIKYNSFNQNTFSKYFDVNMDSDIGFKITKAEDKYYVLCGDYCNQNTVICGGLLCFDLNWNIIWKKELDSLPPAFSDCITTDNKYLYLCTSTAEHDEFEFKLLKFDLDGNLIYSNHYGPFIDKEIPFSISYYNEKLFLNVVFWHNSNVSGYDSTQVWYLNANFDLLYSFTETDRKKFESMIDYLPTKDGNYIGIKSFEKSFQTTQGVVKKFDSNGKLIWASFINGDSQYPQYYSIPKIRPTQDNGCVGIWNTTYEGINNDTFPEQPILFKLDSNGKTEWAHTFYSKRRKYLLSLFEATNGDILGIGYDENPGRTTRFKSTGWVVRFTNKGELLWEHSYIDTSTINGYSYFYDGIEVENENLVFCGTIKPKKDSGVIITNDVWIVKTDKFGCLIPTCDSIQLTTKLVDVKAFIDISIYFSDPVYNHCYIYSDKYIDNVNIKITGINGNVFMNKQKVNLPINFDLSNLPNGIYIISFCTVAGNTLRSEKFLKL